MEFIKNYCYSLIVIAVTVTVIMLLAPENMRMLKYVRWITSLCVILILIVPIFKFSGKITFNSFNNGKDVSIKDNGQDLIIQEFKTKISDIVYELVNDRFNIECSCISVELNSEDVEKVYINNISLNINTKSKFLKEDVEKFLKDKFLCEIKIYG